MPSKFFDRRELLRLENGRIIWIVNVKGDGNCGYHAWLSAVVNGNNMNHIKLKLLREGILTDADKTYINNKTFISIERHGVDLRHYLYKKTQDPPPNRYGLDKISFNNTIRRIASGDTRRRGKMGDGWMENDELQILSHIFKLNIFVQNNRVDIFKSPINNSSTKNHDMSLNIIGDYDKSHTIFLYTSGAHFRVLDAVQSGMHNMDPYINMRFSNISHNNSPKNMSPKIYNKLKRDAEYCEEIVQHGPDGDVILLHNKRTGRWILPSNNLKSKSLSHNTKLFTCTACTFDYNPKKEKNRCPVCRTSKNGTPPNTTTESDRETSALLYAKSIQTAKRKRNISPKVTNSAKIAIKMVEDFKKKETIQSAKKAKKALHNFSKKTTSLQSNLRKINEMERKERKNIKKQVEDNARLARRLRREERRSPSTRSKSPSVSRKRKSPSVSRKRKSPSVSRRKSPSVRKNKSKSKSKSPNNNSASTVQTNSLKSNLRKIKEQQIRENEKFARELRNEQSNHNSPNQQQNNSPNQQQNNSSKSNRQKQMNSNEALARALEGMSNVA